jgi:hypothetical protein
MKRAEPTDAPNPAIAPPFHGERHWRRVGDPGRSVKPITLTRLAGICLLLTGCSHYPWTYVRVEDAVSYEPLASAKITAGLYDPINPDTRRTRTMEVVTQNNGVARIKIPMCPTRGVCPGYLYSGGVFVGRSDPNDDVGPEVIVEKAGYAPHIIYESNTMWRIDGENTSLESPYVIYLRRIATEPAGAAHQGQPVGSQTNRTSGAAGPGG